MTSISILRALGGTLAALALSANGASAEDRSIHPATAMPKVTTNPPPSVRPNSNGGLQVYEHIQLTNGAIVPYHTYHGTTGGTAGGRHRKQ